MPTKSDRLRVLLAMSFEEERSYLEGLLTSWNVDVEVMEAGANIVGRLRQADSPSIAILDFQLGDRTAVEVATEVRHLSSERPAWILIVSEQPDTRQVALANDAGVDDLMLKPIDEFELRVRLRAAQRVQALYGELRKQLATARFHASHCNLTGLWNREATLRLLFQETDRVQRMRTPLTFLLLDIDGFTQINLDHGYPTGDRVLKQIAHRLQRYLRSYDVVGRYGEDEFLIGLPGCTVDQARTMGERIRGHVLHRAIDTGRTLLHLRGSIGVAASRGRSPLVVLRDTERALADAKYSGGDCVRAFDLPTREILAAPLQLPG